jgi:hypothetical protein
MKEIYTEIVIKSSTKVIWNIIINFDNYPNWNPFMKQIIGELQEGSKIQVTIKPYNSGNITYKPKILELKPEEKIKWLGITGIPHLFDGEHSLILKKIDENKVLFIQKEKFTGILVPLLTGLLKNTEISFKMMDEALKKEAEKNIIT